jgi:hypothetical protein
MDVVDEHFPVRLALYDKRRQLQLTELNAKSVAPPAVLCSVPCGRGVRSSHPGTTPTPLLVPVVSVGRSLCPLGPPFPLLHSVRVSMSTLFPVNMCCSRVSVSVEEAWPCAQP